MFRTALISALLLLPACDSKKPAGSACETNENCQDGLICQASLCADAATATKGRVKNLQRTGQTFMHDNSGSCPQLSDLGEQNETTDAWGNKFRILCPSEHSAIDVVSNGPDGQPDTADDIPSW